MQMEKLVSLCKRRGFLFQSSEIYGGLNGFWDYGPLGVELKRNIKDAWWRDMVTAHDDLAVPPGVPEPYEMVGLDCTIIMHPQVWKCSGHYDLFHDYMVDCRESKKRYRHDQVRGRWVEAKAQRIFVATTADAENEQEETQSRALKFFNLRAKDADQLKWDGGFLTLPQVADLSRVLGPDAKSLGTLTEPREFNLMFKTTVGALGGEEDVAFLRPKRLRASLSISRTSWTVRASECRSVLRRWARASATRSLPGTSRSAPGSSSRWRSSFSAIRHRPRNGTATGVIGA